MYTMKQACQQAEMTYETLKFYCNEGLIPNIKRDKNNHRVFDDTDLVWIKSLTCLKKCGMSLEDMKTYLTMCLQGPASIPERKELLFRQRASTLKKIQQLKESIAFIDWKQEYYDGVLAGEIEYQGF